MRAEIRVLPGSSRAGVGGRRGDALLVRVNERAVDGKATEAALHAVAAALGVARRDVTLVRGVTTRDKLVEISGDDDLLSHRWQELLGAP